MAQDISIETAVTAKIGTWGLPLWPLILIAFVALILTMHASLTQDQQIAVFLQSGIYP
jgi:hypothetical protein